MNIGLGFGFILFIYYDSFFCFIYVLFNVFYNIIFEVFFEIWCCKISRYMDLLCGLEGLNEDKIYGCVIGNLIYVLWIGIYRFVWLVMLDMKLCW